MATTTLDINSNPQGVLTIAQMIQNIGRRRGDPAMEQYGRDMRNATMKEIAARTPDPFDSMIKEASLAQIRNERKSGRKATFVVGPRGLEGPIGNAILGGGTSLLGS